LVNGHCRPLLFLKGKNFHVASCSYTLGLL
jgi:hypothetical protein